MRALAGSPLMALNDANPVPSLHQPCCPMSDQRQHRRVGKMEQDRTGGENQQRPTGEQHPVARRLLGIRIVVIAQTARTRMVDGSGWNHQHTDQACSRHSADQHEHYDWSHEIGTSPRNCCGEGVAGQSFLCHKPDSTGLSPLPALGRTTDHLWAMRSVAARRSTLHRRALYCGSVRRRQK